MKRPLIALMFLLSIAVTTVVLLPAAITVQAGSADTVKPQSQSDAGTKDSTGSAADDATVSAAQYCANQGGVVEVRDPYFNTNDIEQNWLQLPGARQFCRFGDGTSRIYVLLSTLYTEKPSLAALAYYAAVPLSVTCNGNPASCYCSQLGGTDLFGGINLNGGGWVLKSDPVYTTLEACIFPDMSSIDSWGLAYHQGGVNRGKNLAHVLRYPNPYSTK
jgi:putative hemolysin